MGTRSNIHFLAHPQRPWEGSINLYSHWDGYPQGMAAKLVNALPHRYQIRLGDLCKKSWAIAFIAGNADNVEIASEDHGDCEYVYQISGQGIACYHYPNFVDGDTKKTVFSGPIADFIQKYYQGDKTLIAVDIPNWEGSERYLITTEIADEFRAHLEENLARFKEGNPNRKTTLAKLAALD